MGRVIGQNKCIINGNFMMLGRVVNKSGLETVLSMAGLTLRRLWAPVSNKY